MPNANLKTPFLFFEITLRQRIALVAGFFSKKEKGRTFYYVNFNDEKV